MDHLVVNAEFIYMPSEIVNERGKLSIIISNDKRVANFMGYAKKELTDAIQLPLKNPTPKQLLRTDVIEAFYVFDSSVPHKFRSIPCELFTSSNIKIYRLPASFPALQFHTPSNQNQLYQWQEKSENQAPQRCQPQAISTVKHGNFLKRQAISTVKHYFNFFLSYFYGSESESEYPWIIYYLDGYPKSGYSEATNPDPGIDSTDPDMLDILDIQIRRSPRNVTITRHGFVDVFHFHLSDSDNSKFCEVIDCTFFPFILVVYEQYHAPPDFKRLLLAKLKYLTACRKLIKLSPNSTPLSSHRRKHLGTSSGKQRSLSLPSPKTDGDEVNVETNAQIDPELARLKTMNVHNAAAIAAQAVAEAEPAMAVAEEAAKDAELAEAEAEVAQAFAEEDTTTAKCYPSQTDEPKLCQFQELNFNQPLSIKMGRTMFLSVALKWSKLNFKLSDSPLSMSTAAMTLLIKPSASSPSSSRKKVINSQMGPLPCLHNIYELLDEKTYFRIISGTTVNSSRLMHIEWKLQASYGCHKCFPRVDMEYSTRRTNFIGELSVIRSTVNDTQGRRRIMAFTAQHPKKHLMKKMVGNMRVKQRHNSKKLSSWLMNGHRGVPPIRPVRKGL
ncbi:unnamed protein product [Brassica napus]|uniref:(rape) hypothetical protein n=1 Tax=Brassica napus TaxID=3708 RepID=A0A816LD13_BRANA|nr:unnamed protein product [Brassica napus]